MVTARFVLLKAISVGQLLFQIWLIMPKSCEIMLQLDVCSIPNQAVKRYTMRRSVGQAAPVGQLSFLNNGK